VFPWVSIAPPYHFTENLSNAGSLILPAFICVSGIFINLRFTGRLPLILGWWGGFVSQALIRAALFGTPLGNSLNPMTVVAFILFSFYMISDPTTTPFGKKSQVAFGFSVAAVHGLLVSLHVVFGLFFAPTAVSGTRGLVNYVLSVKRGMATASLSGTVAVVNYYVSRRSLTP